MSQAKTVEPEVDLSLNTLSEDTLNDLKRSGITENIALKWGIRDVNGHELLQPHETGYIIPYPNHRSFFRIKLTNTSRKMKYIQSKDSTTHIYIPHKNTLERASSLKYLLITEGEKKALAAHIHNIPCVGLGGVWNWRTKTFDVSVAGMKQISDSKLRLKVTDDDESLRAMDQQISRDMIFIAEFCRNNGIIPIICFDTDIEPNPKVQVAAFELFAWMASEQSLTALQLKLPQPSPQVPVKVGLDDALVMGMKLENLIKETIKTAQTVVHPDPKQYIQENVTLNSRISIFKAALAIISQLDLRGNRYRDSNNNIYYFAKTTLHQLDLRQQQQSLTTSAFGRTLVSDYGLRTRDINMIATLQDLMSTLGDVQEITPRYILHRTKDAIYLQLSNKYMAKTTHRKISIERNGTDGVLFVENDQDIDIEVLLAHFKNPRIQCNWWLEVLASTTLATPQQRLASILYYINPWFYGWNGLLVPIEVAVGEACSGKSSLYELRKLILAGNSVLQNPPVDIRDFYAAVANARGMWICDNIGRQVGSSADTFANELCRITTSHAPTVTMRQLHTTATGVTLPIQATMAFTAIEMPFARTDLVQRCMILDFSGIKSLCMDNWAHTMINRYGGREAWLAHHLYVMHKFLQLSFEEWNYEYRGQYRLATFEQAMILMGKVLNTPISADDLTQGTHMVSANPVLEALAHFAEEARASGVTYVTSRQIADWFQENSSQYRMILLREPNRLTRFFNSHLKELAQFVGLQMTNIKRDGYRRIYILREQENNKFIMIPEEELPSKKVV